MSEPRPPEAIAPENVRAIRAGHGANCSSVGSVIDTLFASAAVGTALLAAVVAALGQEPVEIVGDAGDHDEEEAPP